jgi:hypothetical protein
VFGMNVLFVTIVLIIHTVIGGISVNLRMILEKNRSENSGRIIYAR